MDTVRYNNQKWCIDIENNELFLSENKKTRVDIDEVFSLLCDKDQDKIAVASAKKDAKLSVDERISALRDEWDRDVFGEDD